MNQTDEAVALYGSGGGEVGRSSSRFVTVPRGAVVSAVGKTTGRNYGTVMVDRDLQE